MSPAEFAQFRKRFVAASRDVLSGGVTDELAEAAFPAYTNPNPLANFLFWRRVRIAMRRIERMGRLDAALDFGCGGGVMLPFLGSVAQRVVAVDEELGPFEAMRRRMAFPSNIEPFDARVRDLSELPAASFDVVTALDVLEHVDDLDGALGALCRVLRPDGLLLVSGPTENFFYKLGRRISGEAYAGDYHVRNIYEIRAAMDRRMRVTTVATLFYPVPLFKIYAGAVNGPAAGTAG
ncbi:MAG: class I SAM-dependent methyltransferase [Phycisphaerales bacterium]|nr:class I SAM-dependent methyltransferase [Phycisphaerales bacterium]